MKLKYCLLFLLSTYACITQAQQADKRNMYASMAFDYELKYEMPGASVAFGYEMDNFGVELNVSHRKLDNAWREGKFTTFKPMLLLHLPWDNKFSASTGIGGLVGFQRVDSKTEWENPADKKATYFGGAFKLSAEYNFFKGAALFAGYDYEYCVNSIYEKDINITYRHKHIVSMGIKYYF